VHNMNHAACTVSTMSIIGVSGELRALQNEFLTGVSATSGIALVASVGILPGLLDLAPSVL